MAVRQLNLGRMPIGGRCGEAGPLHIVRFITVSLWENMSTDFVGKCPGPWPSLCERMGSETRRSQVILGNKFGHICLRAQMTSEAQRQRTINFLWLSKKEGKKSVLIPNESFTSLNSGENLMSVSRIKWHSGCNPRCKNPVLYVVSVPPCSRKPPGKSSVLFRQNLSARVQAGFVCLNTGPSVPDLLTSINTA